VSALSTHVVHVDDIWHVRYAYSEGCTSLMGVSGITCTMCTVELHDILKVKDTVVKYVLGHRVRRWQPHFNLELTVHRVGTRTVVAM